MRAGITGLYALFGALWISSSDTLLAALVADRDQLVQLGLIKGWLFIGVTALILYLGLGWNPQREAAAAPTVRVPGRLAKPMLGIAALAALLGMALFSGVYVEHEKHEALRLEAMAQMEAAHLAEWSEQRAAQARFGATGEVAQRWAHHRAEATPASAQALAEALERLRRASTSQAVFVVAGDGGVWPSEAAAAASGRASQAAVRASLAAGVPQVGEPHPGPGDVGLVLEVAAPLATDAASGTAALVMQVAAGPFLEQALQQHAFTRQAGAAVLAHADGRVLFAPARTGYAWAGAAPPPAVGPARRLRAGSGDSYLVAVSEVAGTPWRVVTQLPASQVLAHARRDGLWVLFLCAMVAAVLGAGLVVLRQRQVLQLRAVEHERQAEKMRALELLSAITDNLPDSVYAKDLEGRYILFNESACRLTHRRKEEVVGQTNAAIFPAEAAAGMEEKTRQVLRTGEPRREEYSLELPGGTGIYMGYEAPLRDSAGDVIGVFGIAHDVTEQRRMEHELRRSEELHRTMVGALDEGVMIFDHRGRLLAWNPAAEEILGETLEKVRTHDLAGLAWRPVRPDGSTIPLEALPLSQVLRTGRPHRNEILGVPRPQGGPTWLQVNATPLADCETGAQNGAVLSFSDITYRFEAERELARHRLHLEELVATRTGQLEASNAALAARETFLRALADNLPAAIAYWDGELRCRFANKLFAQGYGREVDEMPGLRLPDIARPGRWEVIEPHARAALAGERRDFPATRIWPDGRVSHYWVTYIPGTAGEGFLMLASDVTALRESQLNLERANSELVSARDKAEAASRTKSAFLANMSHEIRTPLNAIIGFTELLSLDATEPAVLQRLEQVTHAARHLLVIINDILDLSKVEAGKLALDERPFSLGAMVRDTAGMVAAQAEAKGLGVSVDLDGVPDGLVGDPTRLSQALLNLLTNAVKFTAHGSIALRVRPVDAPAGELRLRFEVTDTGIGIEAEALARVFQPFEQADKTMARRFGGTGLGLALTRRLARLMGGEVGATSHPGAGSTFWFTAVLRPAEAPCENAASCPGARPQPQGGARVLVVEDNRFNQEVAAAVLQRAGLHVEIACDGREAVARASQERYDLVLMDLHMPVMDGLEATRALRSLPGYASTPVLALTADVTPETREACREAGMDDHLAKPIGATRLYEALVRWLPAAAGVSPATARPPAAGLQERMRGVEGLDTRIGLDLLGDDEAAYEGMLRRFAAQHAEGLPGLDEALAARQSALARRLVHTFAGTAAAIGAGPLRAAAAALEQAIVRGEPAQRLRLAAFDLEYEIVHLAAALQDRLPSAPAQPPADTAQVAGRLRDLRQLLLAGDWNALREYRDMAPALRAAYGAALAPLQDAMNKGDYEAALAWLDTRHPEGAEWSIA
jgi:PAS domain S-box-containing protein